MNATRALAALCLGLTAFVAVQLAHAGTRLDVPEDNQPPFYARINKNPVFDQNFEEILHNDQWAAIPFYRDPDTVPKDFNLLQFFDLRLITGEVVSPLTIQGFEIWEVFPPMGPPGTIGNAPTGLKWDGLGAVPIWFVSWPQLQDAVADGQLTVPDLSSMELRKGFASSYTEVLHPPESAEVGDIIIDARGYLEDGRGFQLNAAAALELSDANNTTTDFVCCSSDHPGQFVHIAFGAIPEPSTACLASLAAGLGGFGWCVRRSNHRRGSSSREC